MGPWASWWTLLVLLVFWFSAASSPAYRLLLGRAWLAPITPVLPPDLAPQPPSSPPMFSPPASFPPRPLLRGQEAPIVGWQASDGSMEIVMSALGGVQGRTERGGAREH